MFYCCACISNQKFLKSFISLYTKWSYRDYIVIMDKSMFHKVCMVLVQAHPNNFTNKCQCIPRLHTDSFRQRNNKTNQHNLQPHVVKIVGVTGKISKWHLEKQAPKVLSKFVPSPKRKCFRHRSTSKGAKLAIRILFAMDSSRKNC